MARCSTTCIGGRKKNGHPPRHDPEERHCEEVSADVSGGGNAGDDHRHGDSPDGCQPVADAVEKSGGHQQPSPPRRLEQPE